MVTVGAACFSMSRDRGCSFLGGEVNLDADFFFVPLTSNSLSLMVGGKSEEPRNGIRHLEYPIIIDNWSALCV